MKQIALPRSGTDISHISHTSSPISNASDTAPSAEDAYDRARELVYRYGWNATAYQILNERVLHWFARAGDAVVGYVVRSRVRIVAGAPVCAETRLPAVMEEFEAEAARHGDRVCYFCAAARVCAALARMPVGKHRSRFNYFGSDDVRQGSRARHAVLVIGAQPVWSPDRWPEILQHNASLRQQVNRARNKGVVVTEWSAEQARNHTGLQRCLDAWIASRGIPPLHFLTKSVSLDRLGDRRLLVAHKEEEPVGFLALLPVPDRDGWMVEQIVRGDSAPNGTPVMLIDATMRMVAGEGARYLTLGLAPLSRRATNDCTAACRGLPEEKRGILKKNCGILEIKGCPHSHDEQRRIRLLLAWMRAHGRRFYNFDGLDTFKAKFRPDHWETLYAISNEPRFSLHTLYAVASAFSSPHSDQPAALGLARLLMGAVRQEITWLHRRQLD